MTTTTMSIAEIETLALETLLASGASSENAQPLAKAIAASEADGIASHGLMYLPIYCLHVKCGKVDGQARPELKQLAPAAILVDAKTGFAHPAINLGFETLPQLAQQNGIAILNIKNSYNCGVLGYHTERLSKHGLLALGFTNAPASIAPVGGYKPLVGTNPFSLAIPADKPEGDVKLLIDQSASVVAKSEIMKRHNADKPIPEGWALDKDGNATTETAAALKGSMVPSGGYKGMGVGMMVEIFAAALSGAHLGINAAPFAGDQGGPPKTGQCFIAIDYGKISDTFNAQIDLLINALTAQEGAHLPGTKRINNRQKALQNGVEVEDKTLDKIRGV